MTTTGLFLAHSIIKSHVTDGCLYNYIDAVLGTDLICFFAFFLFALPTLLPTASNISQGLIYIAKLERLGTALMNLTYYMKATKKF